MSTQTSVIENKKNKEVVETVAQIIFTICASFAILAVVSITAYMIIGGTPAIFSVGLKEILFSTTWKPTAAEIVYSQSIGSATPGAFNG